HVLHARHRFPARVFADGIEHRQGRNADNGARHHKQAPASKPHHPAAGLARLREKFHTSSRVFAESTCRSETNRPSRSRISRRAQAATASSWVISTTVRPSRHKSNRMRITSPPAV